MRSSYFLVKPAIPAQVEVSPTPRPKTLVLPESPKSGDGKVLPLEVKTETAVVSKKFSVRPRDARRYPFSAKAMSLPPTLSAVIECRHVFRFLCVTGFSSLQNITGGNIAGAIGGQCTTANSVVTCPASSIRVNRVTIWPAQQSAPQNPPEITWFSPITVMEKDTSFERILPAGISVPSAVSSCPPKNTLCADWFASVGGASQPMFGLTNMASGNVLDLDVSWTMSNNLIGVDRTVATGSLKTTYYLYLDGSTSHQLQPVGKPSTF